MLAEAELVVGAVVFFARCLLGTYIGLGPVLFGATGAGGGAGGGGGLIVRGPGLIPRGPGPGRCGR